MKIVKKVTCVLLIALIFISFANQDVLAAEFQWKNKTQQLATANGNATEAQNSVSGLVSGIINIARTVAMGVAIVMLIAVAIKYLMAAPGDKADIKKHAVTYVVGAIVLFASSGILTIIAKFADTI